MDNAPDSVTNLSNPTFRLTCACNLSSSTVASGDTVTFWPRPLSSVTDTEMDMASGFPVSLKKTGTPSQWQTLSRWNCTWFGDALIAHGLFLKKKYIYIYMCVCVCFLCVCGCWEVWKSGKQKLSYLRHFKAIHLFHLRQSLLKKYNFMRRLCAKSASRKPTNLAKPKRMMILNPSKLEMLLFTPRKLTHPLKNAACGNYFQCEMVPFQVTFVIFFGSISNDSDPPSFF